MTVDSNREPSRVREHDARTARIQENKAREKQVPIAGSLAPDFALSVLGTGMTTLRLSALRGQVVALVFGSYTCGPLRKKLPLVNDLYERFQERIAFFFIYTREAHEGDPIRIASQSGRTVGAPSTMEERSDLASACATEATVTMPILVDELSDDVTIAYGGMPNRLYLIDENGYVVYRSEMGPEGFKPKKLEKAIEKHLAEGPTAKQEDSPG